jgi:hypothetical protein
MCDVFVYTCDKIQMFFITSIYKMLGKQVGKFVSDYGWALFAGIVILLVLYRYDRGKSIFPNTFNTQFSPSEYNGGGNVGSDGGGAVKAAAESLGQNSGPATVQGMAGTTVSGGSASTQNIDPAELLPNDANSNWTGVQGSADMMGVNALSAGHFMGAVSSCIKNQSYDIRSEPPNPRLDTGVWNQSTIETDFQRRGVEIS